MVITRGEGIKQRTNRRTDECKGGKESDWTSVGDDSGASNMPFNRDNESLMENMDRKSKEEENIRGGTHQNNAAVDATVIKRRHGDLGWAAVIGRQRHRR